MSNSILVPHLADAMVRVTEVAAIAAQKLAGLGDEKAADQAAVDAMRTAFNSVDFQGRIVIGEGERDEAPMLYIGEEVGTGQGPEIDIALDPLEGTTLTAKAMANALAVLAIAPRGVTYTITGTSALRIFPTMSIVEATRPPGVSSSISTAVTRSRSASWIAWIK